MEGSLSDLSKILKEQRKKKNMTIDELSALTRIPERIILLIEEERWGELPEPVYIKSFLRKMARFLELDESEIVSFFESAFSQEHFSPRIEDVPVKKKKLAGVSAVKVWGILFILLAVVLIGIYLANYKNLKDLYIRMVQKKGMSVAELENKTLKTSAKVENETASVSGVDKVDKGFFSVTVMAKGKDKCWYMLKTDTNRKEQGFIDSNNTLEFTCYEKCSLKLGNPRAVVINKEGERIEIPSSFPFTIVFYKKGFQLLRSKGVQN